LFASIGGADWHRIIQADSRKFWARAEKADGALQMILCFAVGEWTTDAELEKV
jgi:hypothetical protein